MENGRRHRRKPQLLTVKQVREVLPLSAPRIYQLIESGALAHVAVGKRLFVLDVELEKFVAALEPKGGRRVAS